MDFRLIGRTREWMEKEGLLGDCDVVSVAGAGKGIADEEAGEKDVLMKQIGLSCDLHKATRVVLLHHSDCGAYANAYDFKGADEEKDTQLKDMAKAENIIRQARPGVEVVKVWAEMKDPEGEHVEFERLG